MSKRSHPYRELPPKAFWRSAVAGASISEVDPVGRFDLRISAETKVATAGSCFAQHIARYLASAGFNYFVAEEGHPLLSAELQRTNNYGIFSARYGNIYTARQLRQLVDRAWDRFHPNEEPWIDADGSVRDPFRPAIQPGNFLSVAEMLADRAQHLAAVQDMFRQLDVFVFTLGLTETWRSRVDGAVFPLCPGVEGGTFNPELYEFYNQSVTQVVDDMNYVFGRITEVNSKAQFVLTVSPVPLAATAVPDEHVLTATTYSKSVLRVAAQTLADARSSVHYFPSYEIVTGAFNRGRYYAADLRNVVEDGVAHVMRLFLRHATDGSVALPLSLSDDAKSRADFLSHAQEVVEVECEEAFLNSFAIKSAG